MKQAIYNQLSADYTFMNALSGGLYHEIAEIKRQDPAAAFDSNGEILPCGLLKMSEANPIPPYNHGARLSFELYFYQRAGYASIEAARERAYDLLHYQRLTPVGQTAGCWEIHHLNDITQQEDDALRCSLEVARFEAIVRRR